LSKRKNSVGRSAGPGTELSRRGPFKVGAEERRRDLKKKKKELVTEN